MGRLSTLIVASLTIAACDKPSSGGAADVPSSRSESISVASNMPSPSAATSTPTAHATASAPARKLCESELAQPGRKLPKGTFAGVGAASVVAPADKLATGNGRWTWINFFAAWCGPCKEEMPRLRTFQQKLSANLDVAFVSLDDDERQLRQFLEAQPAQTGVKSALWLQPGKSRSSWLSGLNMKDPPDLPAHVLVDPSGKVRCAFGGAIEESDFPTVAAIVKR